MHDYLAPDSERLKADDKALRELRRTVRQQRRLLWISMGVSLLALAASAALVVINVPT
jgi:hypothetical protein